MRQYDARYAEASKVEAIMSVCCGNPHEDELPQIGTEEDMLLDVCSDIMNTPREYAAARLHHQWSAENEGEAIYQ